MSAKKQYNQIRNDKIEIPLNNEEKNKIIGMAKKEGLPVATFIRWKLLKT